MVIFPLLKDCSGWKEANFGWCYVCLQRLSNILSSAMCALCSQQNLHHNPCKFANFAQSCNFVQPSQLPYKVDQSPKPPVCWNFLESKFAGWKLSMSYIWESHLPSNFTAEICARSESSFLFIGEKRHLHVGNNLLKRNIYILKEMCIRERK